MNYTTSRLSALREALRRTLARPVAYVLVVGSTGLVFSTMALCVLALWRVLPMDAPAWMRPEALVLAAGAEGENDLAATRAALRQVGLVASVDFVGRDAALAELAQRKSLAMIGLNELRPNPLPDAFVVRFAAGATPDAVEAAVAELRKVKSVDSVEYQPDAYRKLSALAQLAGRLSLLLAASVAGALVIGVALAATFWARVDREEMRVLHLLGADPSSMRRPYVYAGAINLVVAAALAWWILISTAGWLEPAIANLAQQYSLHWAQNPLPQWSGAVFCLGMGLLGAVLASVSARLATRR